MESHHSMKRSVLVHENGITCQLCVVMVKNERSRLRRNIFINDAGTSSVYKDRRSHCILLCTFYNLNRSSANMRVLEIITAAFLACSTAAAPLNQSIPGPIPGTTSHYVGAGGHRYHYLSSTPSHPSKGTVLLLHGFVDFSYAWRYQVPFLTSLGYRVIAPDLLGYADTDSPCELSNWALKKLSADMVELLDQIAPGERIILGGHDWGAILAYKIAMWHPDYLKAFFTITVPYVRPWLGPSPEWVDISDLVQKRIYPTLGYQLQWRDPAIDRNFTSSTQIAQFLNAGFGALTTEGEAGISSGEGILYDKVPLLGPNSLVNGTDFDFYVEKTHQKGMRGAFNWYRVRRMDWEDELPFARDEEFKFKTPSLFIGVTKDAFMIPELSEGMDHYFEDLTMETVDTGHWAMMEDPEGVNRFLEKWIGSLQ
jgi:soluble epoxide hydrolase/lipid-phosphate phosphatase